MSHTLRNRDKLINRVRRIRGQMEALERALVDEHECGEILQQMSASRGAINSLMAELLEGHIRFHMTPRKNESESVEELVDVVKTYLK